jgi:hypothetical protein
LEEAGMSAAMPCSSRNSPALGSSRPRRRATSISFGRGAAEIVAAGEAPPAYLAAQADVVIDTVGAAALAEAFVWLRRRGIRRGGAGPDRCSTP